MWVGSERDTLCASASEESDSLVNNAPLTLKSCYVTLTFETKIHRLEWFAQVILISATPMLQNLRIGLKKRRNGKSKVPVKQHSSHLRKIGAGLRHQRKESLLWTPVRQCT